MLTISSAQMSAIGEAAAETLVMELVGHARTALPSAVVGCDDAAVAKATRTALRRAMRLGWTTTGPARHYVECALLFGCDVAHDPFHPWFAQGLASAATRADGTHADAADATHAALLAAWPMLFGEDSQRLPRALDRLMRFDAVRAFDSTAMLETRIAEVLHLLYPGKWLAASDAARQALARAGVERCARGMHAATSGQIACLQLYFGHGVLIDPLYGWVRETLAPPRSSGNAVSGAVSNTVGKSASVSPLEQARLLMTQIRSYGAARLAAEMTELGEPTDAKGAR